MSIKSTSLWILATVYGLIGIYLFFLYRMEPFWYNTEKSNKDCCTNCVQETNLSDYLTQLRKIFHKKNVTQTLRIKLEEIIEISQLKVEGKELRETILKDNNYSHEETNIKVTQILDVCPEKWTGRGVNNIYYLNTWTTENCSNALPFPNVLTVLIIPTSRSANCSEQVNPVLQGLEKTYGRVPVIAANVGNFCGDIEFPLHVQLMTIKSNQSNPGQVWNSLVNAVTTPYVLIGRDLDNFMWFTDLKRPVRILKNSEVIQIAGGAIRNQTGHWRVGCQQSSLSNYILEYNDGYHSSKNDCMFCDHLLGPFVSRTLFLRDNPFNDSLPEEVLFEDFFLKLKQSHHSVVNCPDVMYLSTNPLIDYKLVNRTMWLPLVRKWELNRIVVGRNRVFSYSCEESGVKCRLPGFVESYLMPICCVEQMSRALIYMDKFCRQHKIPYEFAGGTLMGIVKMGDIMPWDHDGDLFYLGNYSIFKEHKNEFEKYGYRVGPLTFVLNEYRWSYFTPEVVIDMSGCAQMSYDSLEDKMFREVPTQAQLHGHWFYVMPNPGGFSRNYYGIETLKHAHHYYAIGQKFSAPYTGGHFKKCKKPLHHACLDHFSADGSLQFYVPN